MDRSEQSYSSPPGAVHLRGVPDSLVHRLCTGNAVYEIVKLHIGRMFFPQWVGTDTLHLLSVIQKFFFGEPPGKFYAQPVGFLRCDLSGPERLAHMVGDHIICTAHSSGGGNILPLCQQKLCISSAAVTSIAGNQFSVGCSSKQWANFLCSVCAKWLRVLYRCWPSGVYRKMHPSCKASGKKRYIPQAAKCPSLSCSVSLLEPNMSDKTKVQRWTLFLGGDGIGKKKKGNSSIWYGRA